MSKSINATHYDRIPAFGSKDERNERIVHAVIETPKSSPHKYDYSPEYGIIAFKHVLPHAMRWPYDYGFIPQTRASDGDGLDILILGNEPLFSGCLIKGRVIGAFRETKDGVENDRLIAVRLPSPGVEMPTDSYHEIADLPERDMNEIKAFLVGYSEAQGHDIAILEAIASSEAMKIVMKTLKHFQKNAA